MQIPTESAPVAFVDTSAIVALVDRGDLTHQAAVNTYHALIADGYRLFTTNHVVTETFDLLHSTLGAAVARQWLEATGLSVYVTDSVDEQNARERILSSNTGKPLRYSDAVSFAVMERLGVTDAFAVDPDFLNGLE